MGKIKAWLSNFGFSVFLAHEDIEPSLEWQKVIVQNLKKCHVFIPIITKEFDESKWTDQESGMAFLQKKLIIPVAIEGHNPRGFIAIFQALPMSRKEVEKGCIQIIRTIKSNPRLTQSVLELLITKLEKSGSYASSEWITSLISEYLSFTKEQLDSILKFALENNQVHFAAGSRVDLKEIIKKNKEMVDPGVLKALNAKDKDFSFG